MKLEKEIMSIIASSGTSKNKAFEALKKIKERDFDGARELIKESREIDLEAHNVQTKLIAAEFSDDPEEKPELNLLMVHAQDHYMTCQLARELAEVLIDVFESREE